MTEAAAFSSAAQKDSFTELGVERFKVVATFDKDTCEVCGAMDGKVFKMSEYQVGLTVPPFHPWCRCCTAPYFEDMAGIGERWARSPDGTTAKVPPDMAFEEWKQKFVHPGQGAGGEVTHTPGEVVQIGKVDFTDMQAVREQLIKAQADFAGLDYEMNCTVTSDGKVWRVTGSGEQVNPWGIEAMGSSLKGSYSYHNHPAAKTWYSFSAEDVQFFFASGAECAIASDDLYEYIMRRTKGTIDVAPDVVYHEFGQLRYTVWEHADQGIVDINFDEYHDTMQMLSEKYKFQYGRRRLNASR